MSLNFYYEKISKQIGSLNIMLLNMKYTLLKILMLHENFLAKLAGNMNFFSSDNWEYVF